jgi:Holliday junction DNA helicase RuvA
MISFLEGKIESKTQKYVVLKVAGIGFKVFISSRTSRGLPKIGQRAKLFCATLMNRETIELYGFLNEKELEIFELLNSINGVGPKSALGILGALKIEKFLAAVSQGRDDLLIKSWGIGGKKAQRIVLELKDKIKKSKEDISELEVNKDVKSALRNFGYKEKEIELAMNKISAKSKKFEERIKQTLKFLSKK